MKYTLSLLCGNGSSGIYKTTALRYLFPPLMVLLLVLRPTVLKAENTDLAFHAAGKGYFSFDTGQLRGKMRADGQYQGICSLIHIGTAMEIVKSPGLLSYYRLFSRGVRYGETMRDWPVVTKVNEDGSLELRFPPAKEHPMEVVAIYRWRDSDTLDLETTVKASSPLDQMEVFLSSYFVDSFDSFIYVKRNRYGTGQPATFMSTIYSELLEGNYLMFPRDEKALLTIYDGRWSIPPSPVTWAFIRYFEAPIAIRQCTTSGLTVVFMSLPQDCFAIGTSYDRLPPDIVSSHKSTYISLFGADLSADQSKQARCRVIFGKHLSHEAVLTKYNQYLREYSTF